MCLFSAELMTQVFVLIVYVRADVLNKCVKCLTHNVVNELNTWMWAKQNIPTSSVWPPCGKLEDSRFFTDPHFASNLGSSTEIELTPCCSLNVNPEKLEFVWLQPQTHMKWEFWSVFTRNLWKRLASSKHLNDQAFVRSVSAEPLWRKKSHSKTCSSNAVCDKFEKRCMMMPPHRLRLWDGQCMEVVTQNHFWSKISIACHSRTDLCSSQLEECFEQMPHDNHERVKIKSLFHPHQEVTIKQCWQWGS